MPKKNPALAGMVACVTKRKLGSHEPGTEILMHPRDAKEYAAAGIVDVKRKEVSSDAHQE